MSLSTAGHGVEIDVIINDLGPPAELVKTLIYSPQIEQASLKYLPVWTTDELSGAQIAEFDQLCLPGPNGEEPVLKKVRL